MKRFFLIFTIGFLILIWIPTTAGAAFGFNYFDLAFTEEDGTAATKAGTHPFAMTTSFGTNVDSEGFVEGQLKDLFLQLIPGLAADTTAYERCTTLQYLERSCPPETVVGISANSTSEPGLWVTSPLFNLTPPPGVLARFGFRVDTANIVVDAGLSQDPPYIPVAVSRKTPQMVSVFANKTQVWGDPSASAHDGLRGSCGISVVKFPTLDIPGFEFESQGKSCPIPPQSKPFLTLPTNCAAPLTSRFEAFSWTDEKDTGETQLPTLTDCEELSFEPSIDAQPTNRTTHSPTGLDVSLEVDDVGLTSIGGTAQSHIRKVVFALPEGMVANPSIAEGLGVCSEAELGRETLHSAPGEGCPQAAKIGTLEVESPLIDQPVKGSLYQATPRANLAENSLLAFYFVIKNPELGIVVKQPTKVVPDPRTGQLVAITDEIPQLPFSHFNLHFREGGRSPLVSPPLCGLYEAKAVITPWSGQASLETTSTFDIASGPDGGPCPSGGVPPFDPGFIAGSRDNAGGAYSPFSMRLTRRDGDQDLTRFDATLPPGIVAKLAGVAKCSDAQIALAKTKPGVIEQQNPSCPIDSRIGSVKAGAGVGSQLTYAAGSVYLAGPFAGAPLSVVGIVPAVAGPFDVGTVVTRQALVIDPRTAEVRADGAKSDPLPHILAGIPLAVRDIQVHIDRENFTLNPTSCDPLATTAQIWGGGSDLFGTSDDASVTRRARYQAAGCQRLGFKPRLSLKLQGGTKRGAHPTLRAVLRPRPGDANIENAVARLPKSAFLDQAHIRTICTRVQYVADSCPQGAVYGYVRAFSPLLEEPLQGPAYLRSSNHKLPDLVFSLHGLVDFETVARIDSKRGGIRATFADVPDVPITKVIIAMQGGKKGLIVNSTDLCAAKRRANVRLDAHNGKGRTIRPLMRTRCRK